MQGTDVIMQSLCGIQRLAILLGWLALWALCEALEVTKGSASLIRSGSSQRGSKSKGKGKGGAPNRAWCSNSTLCSDSPYKLIPKASSQEEDGSSTHCYGFVPMGCWPGQGKGPCCSTLSKSVQQVEISLGKSHTPHATHAIHATHATHALHVEDAPHALPQTQSSNTDHP